MTPDLGAWAGTVAGEITGQASDHSAILKCSCGKRGWHTKNISYIGARNIYNFKGGCEWMQQQMTCNIECDCSPSELSVDMELIEHVRACKECRDYGL